jgi:hypothetical protein
MLFWRVFRLTPVDPVTINTARWTPCPPAGCFAFAIILSAIGGLFRRGARVVSGGVPEWLKGTDCKSVGLAYVGSNPTPSTNPLPWLAGVAQW